MIPLIIFAVTAVDTSTVALVPQLSSLPLFFAACLALGFGLTFAIVAESPRAPSSNAIVHRLIWLRLGALLCAVCATIPVAALLLSPQDSAYTTWAWPWAVTPLLGTIILVGIEDWRSGSERRHAAPQIVQPTVATEGEVTDASTGG